MSTIFATPTRKPDPSTSQPRPSRLAGLAVPVLATVLALAIGAVIIAAADERVRGALGYFTNAPSDTLAYAWSAVSDAYAALIHGAIYDPSRSATLTEALSPITQTLTQATPLVLAGLGVSVAFRSGLFNIGGQGQTIAGAMAAGYVGFAVDLPIVIHLLAALAAGLAFGALWGLLAGVLKARAGVNEIITTIMLNYVALYVLRYLLSLGAVIQAPGAQASRTVDTSARLPHLFGAGFPLTAGTLLALAAAYVTRMLFTRTTLGFKLRAVGANPAAARTAGIPVDRLTMTAMALSGALAGLAGATLVLGGSTSYQITPNIDSGIGFVAITVALLGRLNTGGILLSGLLLSALNVGGAYMQSVTNVPADIVTIIQALIITFIAAPRLISAVSRLKLRDSDLLASATSPAVAVMRQRSERIPRHVTVGALQIAAAVAAAVVLFTSSRTARPAPVSFSLADSTLKTHPWLIPTRETVLVLCALALLAGIGRLTRRLPALICALGSILPLIMGVILWSIAGTTQGINMVSLLQGSLFPAAIPLIFGTLAGVIGERAGLVNVALEGQLLLSAFGAAVAGSLIGTWAGLAAGIFSGACMAALLGLLAIRYLVDQVIAGVALNLLALGLTSFLYLSALSLHASTLNSPAYFGVWSIPGLSAIPVVGPVLFSGTIFLYLAYTAVAACAYALFRTKWGLRVRAVGEHPRAADTVGINVRRTRWHALLIAGALAGLGGAFLTIGTGSAGTFQISMSAGKGYITLAAVIFGRWRPLGAVGAALLFGFADQLQSLLSQAGAPINSNLLLALPYAATLLAVAGFVGHVQGPAAGGQPYAGR
ncbi:ABC transporter permease subunit (plasmid) [Streptomyces sp. AHU1]|uniref:ABC transporter permease subunit n=1 Tax=Streptomyces sp. AHU1 TaxID=3377215 RepID=UPI003877B225